MENQADIFRSLRASVGDDVDEIVRWQMTGWVLRRAPVVNKPPAPLCGRCGGEWHGLPADGCPGSFDTPGPE